MEVRRLDAGRAQAGEVRDGIPRGDLRPRLGSLSQNLREALVRGPRVFGAFADFGISLTAFGAAFTAGLAAVFLAGAVSFLTVFFVAMINTSQV